jgi:hypothetical protein
MSDPTHRVQGGLGLAPDVSRHLAENMVKKPLNPRAFCKMAHPARPKACAKLERGRSRAIAN